MSAGAFAQSALTTTPTSVVALDTNTNAMSGYLYTSKQSGNEGNFSFQYVGTKISGTVAGVVTLEGSLDGINYTRVMSDSLLLTDVTTNTKVWDVTAQKRLYYRTKVTTTGTVSLQNKGFYITR